MKALPFDLPMLWRSLHLVISPNGEKKALSPSSVVSKDNPWTKSSSLPSFSSETAGASSAAAGSSALVSAGLASESESDPEPELDPLNEAAFLAAFLAGLASDSESEPDELEDEAAFLAGAFLAGLASEESLSDPDDDEDGEAAFLALAGAFLAGLASLESESDDEDDDAAFLAALAAAFFGATTLTLSSDDDESESELELSSTFFFFCGTAAFSDFLAALLLLAFETLLTLDAALGLLAAGFLFSDSEELLDDELEEELLATLFFSTFLEDFDFLSMLCFLLGASDELADLATIFFDF